MSEVDAYTSSTPKEEDEYEVTIDMPSFSGGSTDSDSDSSAEAITTSSSPPIHKSTSKTSPEPTTWLGAAVTLIKNIFSASLLLFCVIVVSAAIFQKQTTATGDYTLHPIIAFVVFWVLLLWLALMEGGLNCMVGLVPVDKALYASSHPLALRSTTIAHKGHNIDRFIVGRQYLDLMTVFLTSFMVSAIDDARVLGLPQSVSEIFLGSGLAVILCTIVVGQLIAQINSATHMLDFINNYVMVATTYAALTIEASGILHAVYFVQVVASKIAGTKDSQTSDRTIGQSIFFWVRVAFSVSLLLVAFIITLKALFDGDTTMWETVPAYGSVIILVVLILVVGMMEGLQIALMAVVHMPEDQVQQYPVAKRNVDFMFGTDFTLQAFLVGRQILQTIIMFVIARITTLDPKNDNIFGVSDGWQSFFNTGILGALISTIVASLSWRVVASSFPLAFLSNPLGRPIMHLCLAAENTGICSIAWGMAKIHRRLVGMKNDDYYLKMAHEESAEKTEDLGLTERASEEADDNV